MGEARLCGDAASGQTETPYRPLDGSFDEKVIWLNAAYAEFAREAEVERERHSGSYVFPQDMGLAELHRRNLCASAATLARRVLDILSDMDGDDVARAFGAVFRSDDIDFYW